MKVVDAADAPSSLGTAGERIDLVVDAAYGTGFKGTYDAPSVPEGTNVLAVDIPSGVDGDTGAVSGAALRADTTVTFAALKPGLLQGDGPALTGRVELADIGLDASRAHIWLVEDEDVRRLVPPRARDSYKWQSAVVVIAGSPGMVGAASFSAMAAYRSGAGMVRLAVPGASEEELPATEAVAVEIDRHGWAGQVLEVAKRCKAVVIGPGLGRDPDTATDVRSVVASSPVPVVVDADGLFALGKAEEVAEVVGARRGEAGPVVLTPHSGEFANIFGRPPGEDHIEEAQDASVATGCVFLLKGPTTVVASAGTDDQRRVRVVMSGGPNLATAGTGDVLSGAIGAFIARGAEPFEAAALAAHVHGRAASLGPTEGLVAGDLPDLIARWLSFERTGGSCTGGERSGRWGRSGRRGRSG